MFVLKDLPRLAPASDTNLYLLRRNERTQDDPTKDGP